MPEFTTEQITQYLQKATELEASIYRQSETIKASKKSLKLDEPAPLELAEPILKEYTRPQNPQNNQKQNEDIKRNTRAMIAGGIGFICLGVISCLVELMTLGIICCCLGAFFVLITVLAVVGEKEMEKQMEKQMEKYKVEIASYEEKTVQAEREYQVVLQKYKSEKEALDETYNSHMEFANKKYALAKDEILKMEQALAETKTILEQLYAIDLIFPKYRGLVPMSTMCEYFLTGRCTELAGPNGAYNLYESELHQNLIINKLDQIRQSLEMIRENQYIIYSELKSMNETVRAVSNDIKDLCDTTKNIEYSSRVAANCAKITAKNTEALKYITLINRR